MNDLLPAKCYECQRGSCEGCPDLNGGGYIMGFTGDEYDPYNAWDQWVRKEQWKHDYGSYR